jgi:hypothetical protein
MCPMFKCHMTFGQSIKVWLVTSVISEQNHPIKPLIIHMLPKHPTKSPIVFWTKPRKHLVNGLFIPLGTNHYLKPPNLKERCEATFCPFIFDSMK